MSPCPECGAKAEHVGVLLPWKPGERVQVLLRCPDCSEESLFFEYADDPVAIAHKARLSLEALEKANGQSQSILAGVL